MKEENFYYDKLHGTVKKFCANGKPEAVEIWYNGMLHGSSKYFDSTGQLSETRKYYYGSLLAVNKEGKQTASAKN